MFTDILQPTHLLFVLVVALLVLGPKRLPEVARTLGNGLRDFRAAISGESDDDDEPDEPGHHILPDEQRPDYGDPKDLHGPHAADSVWPPSDDAPRTQTSQDTTFRTPVDAPGDEAPEQRPHTPSASKPQPRR